MTERRFELGQQVRTYRADPGRHTRLPRFARDALGTIVDYEGEHPLPDEQVVGHEVVVGVYTVAFDAAQFFSGARHTIALSLFENYLEPA